MSTQGDRLERWKQVAQIASAVAVPVVLAILGYFVQRSLADAGLKKDYVQMALSVLKEAPSKENEQLRKWAIAVLDKNSPVPLPPSLKVQLETSKSFNFRVLGVKDREFEERIECKPVPDPQTLEWLLKTYPLRYVRCPNGQVGEKIMGLPDLTKFLIFPPTPAASSK